MEKKTERTQTLVPRAVKSSLDWRAIIIVFTLISAAVALVSGTHSADWYYPLIILGVALFLDLIPGKNAESWKPLLVLGCIVLSMILIFMGGNLTDFGHEWTYPVAVGYLILFIA